MKRFFRLLFLLVFSLSSWNSYAQLFSNIGQNNFDKMVKKYGSVLYLMDSYYIDTVNVEQLVDEAIISSIKTLDPHSYYISKEEYKSMSEPLMGNFEGIGIEFSILEDTLIVVSPLSGGPSEKVGLKSSDRIIKVDGENIAGVGLTNERVHSLLRGTKGTKISITVKRGSSILDFDIIRDKIPLNSLDAAYEIKPGMVYVKLSRFAKNSMPEIYDAISEFKSPKSMILDLRGNGGGFMPVAIELADMFLNKGQLIVYTEGRNVPKQEAFATGKGTFKQGNLVILIDEGSASASEIVSGAIQDWDRGIIIGRRSFGKGLVQQEFPLNDGSAVRLTVSRYHTPSGRAIQTPYEKGKTEQYYTDFYERYTNEAFNADSIKFADSLKFNTLVKGRTVYGGGGIMPDIYVPLDTSRFSKYSSALLRKGTIFQFMSGYMDKNRTDFQNKFSSFDDFNKNFKVSDNLFNGIVEAGEKDGIKRDDEGIEISKEYLNEYIKALIARDLFSSSDYFKIVNESDPTYNKAIEVLSNWKRYDSEILK